MSQLKNSVANNGSTVITANNKTEAMDYTQESAAGKQFYLDDMLDTANTANKDNTEMVDGSLKYAGGKLFELDDVLVTVNAKYTTGTMDSCLGCVPGGKPFDLDDVLAQELGQFRRSQLVTVILASLSVFTSPFMSEYIFSAATIPHRCQIPECGEHSKSSTFEPPWLAHALPRTSSGLSSCQRFAPLASNGTLDYCPASLFDNSTTAACEAFVYARNNSVVYDFDLGCAEWRRALAGWVGAAGTMLALPAAALVSDRRGRRLALTLSILNMALFGLLRAFSVSYAMYLALQFVQFALGAGTYSSALILATELVGPKHRVVINCVVSNVYSLGACMLAGVAWLAPSWRAMIFALHAPCLLLVPLYYWWLPESVRWLLSQHKYDEAREVLQNVAAANRTRLSEKSFQALKEARLMEKSKGPGVIKTILGSRVLLRRMCTTPVWWVSTTLAYYGLSINATSLSDQMYLNYILTSAVEVPGCVVAVLLLDRIGRKATISTCFLLSAVCNIAFMFVPLSRHLPRLALHLVGKCAISVVFTGLYLYTTELYPTECRHSLLAFSSMVGRVGSMVAPLTPALMMYWEGLPSLLFGVSGLASGLLVLTQPETLGAKLPDTLRDAEAL